MISAPTGFIMFSIHVRHVKRCSRLAYMDHILQLCCTSLCINCYLSNWRASSLAIPSFCRMIICAVFGLILKSTGYYAALGWMSLTTSFFLVRYFLQYSHNLKNKSFLQKTVNAGGRVCTQIQVVKQVPLLTCRDSSVGRASDWRSEGPWFNPGSRQNFVIFCFILCG